MSQPHFSLLSLSVAASNAAPIVESTARPVQGPTTTAKHRRLSSAGRSRRRLSDARDAATRPFPTSLQTASVSLAALSLSSPTASHRAVHGAQPIGAPPATSTGGTSEPEPPDVDDAQLSASPPQSRTPLAPNFINLTKSGRKRGTIFTCESCSKVYRHPSCLIKHRWEHTPQWREASKFVLSKHQQVQLLEAAAILSHLSPSSASLPEDRSLWPSFLSGGLVPPPVPSNDIGPTPTTIADALPSPPMSISASSAHTSFPISSSVPVSTVLGSHDAGSSGPRLHDYAVNGDGIGITHVRPGMLGVPTAPMPMIKGGSSPVPVPAQAQTRPTTREDDALNLLALRSASVTSESWGSPTSLSHARAYSYSHARSHSHSLSRASRETRERRRSNAYEYGSGRDDSNMHRANGTSGHAYMPLTNGGWSLPRSSVRSKSGSSRSQSQSASESRSDDEDEGVLGEVDVDVDAEVGADLQDRVEGRTDGVKTRVKRGWVYGSRARTWGTTVDGEEDVEEDKDLGMLAERTWDGMEMEMEMD